jgi:LPXTG-motif cell wall-anchored protein
VQILRRVVVLLAAAALCAPVAAIAQTRPVPASGSGVSTQPPVQLESPPPPPPPPAHTPPPATNPARGSELPNTGSDPRLLFLVGVALTLFGVGLRLRTADAELY